MRPTAPGGARLPQAPGATSKSEAARLVLIIVASLVLLSTSAPRLDDYAARSRGLASLKGAAAQQAALLFAERKGDGMHAPAASAALLVSAAATSRQQHTVLACDHPPRDPSKPTEQWRSNIFVPPQPWTPFTSEQTLTWLSKGGGGTGAGRPTTSVQVTELYRFTEERRAIIEAYSPALEVPNVEHLHMMSPALVWIGNRYLAFLRVSNYPDELYDNFLWVQEFSESLQPLPRTGMLVGLPTHSANLMAPGPEDPRALLFQGSLLVLFNLQFRNNDRRQVLYNHDTRKLVVLNVQGLAFQRAEKNWMPFVFADKLHLVYQLDPLVVIRCEVVTGACVCVVPTCDGSAAAHNTRKAIARGGTSMTQVGDNLFFGLIHSTFGDHAIRGHMMLFSTAPMGVVAVTTAVPLPEALTSCYADTVPWDVQFPSSMTLLGGADVRGAQQVLLGVHVRDAMAALLLVEMGAPLGAVIERVHAESCAEPHKGGCSRWVVMENGEVDAKLREGLGVR